jgi:HK97 family phage portal protein
MTPVATTFDWVAWYAYLGDLSTILRVEQDQVLHWRWLLDPLLPGAGLSPMQAILRETDSDDELTRFVKALLQNDATPRTGLKIPEGRHLSDDEANKLRRDWSQRYGGERRGSVGILWGGLEPVRIALGLDELEVEAVRNAFEARIAAVLRVPPIIAQLYVGLLHGREGNYESTRRLWAEQTLIPAWTAFQSEINRALVPQYEDDIYVAFDLTRVRALTDNEDTRHSRLLEELRSGAITIDEYRAEKGRGPLPDGAGEARVFADSLTGDKPAKPVAAATSSTGEEQPV